jgi:hypothetical protein
MFPWLPSQSLEERPTRSLWIPLLLTLYAASAAATNTIITASKKVDGCRHLSLYTKETISWPDTRLLYDFLDQFLLSTFTVWTTETQAVVLQVMELKALGHVIFAILSLS